MNLRRMLLREIAHRKFSFAVALLSVAVAVGCGVGAIQSLRGFDVGTEQLQNQQQEASRKVWETYTARIAEQERRTAEAWATYQDEVRKDMLELGFDLMILHKDQNLSNPDDHAVMLPESYAEKLAASQLVDINHLLPFIQQKFFWPERKRWITLVGTTGEVYIKNPKVQTPMLQDVPAGQAFLGYSIHEGLGLKEGDTFELAGREFTVAKTMPAKSFQEDENVYIPLRAAQELLDKPGRITGMLAINCMCNPEGLLGIQRNVQELLPDTRVIEYSSTVIARANVRVKAAQEAETNLARTRENRERAVTAAAANAQQMLASRAQQRSQRTAISAVLIGIVVVVSAVLVGVLMWENVRRREMEIGILRAIGVTGRKLLTLFLAKALLIGVLGAIAGYVGGMVFGMVQSSSAVAADPALLGGSVLAAALLAAIASWIPARMAAGIDPAVVLQREGA